MSSSSPIRQEYDRGRNRYLWGAKLIDVFVSVRSLYWFFREGLYAHEAPPKARGFVEALLNLLDEVTLCDFDDYELGIKCFDTLTFGQKILDCPFCERHLV
jgi:hypothetical protein